MRIWDGIDGIQKYPEALFELQEVALHPAIGVNLSFGLKNRPAAPLHPCESLPLLSKMTEANLSVVSITIVLHIYDI